MDVQLGGNSQEKACRHDHDSMLGLKRNGSIVWGLRNDVRRVIVYELDEETQGINHVGYVHPSEAVVVALFDGRRTIHQVEKEVAGLFDISPEVACSAVDTVLKRWSICLDSDCTPETPRYDPLQFVIPADKVDLAARRACKPMSLLFHISDDCMRHCVYCNVNKRVTRDTRQLTLQRWQELIQEVVALPVLATTLGGGDPFMHSQIMAILKMFFDAKIKFFLTTKSHITGARAETLAAIGLKRIQISIDAPHRELADYLVGTPGFFKQALNSIRNLRSCGIKVRTNSVLTRHSLPYVSQLVKLLVDLGVDSIQLGPVGRSFYADSEDLLCDYDDLQKLDAQLPELRSQLPLGVQLNFSFRRDDSLIPVEERAKTFPRRSLCSAGRWAMIVLSDGKVILCDELAVKPENVVGDVTTQSLMDVWNSDRLKQFISPPQEKFRGTACFDCTDFSTCHSGAGRCFRDALKAFGTLYAPAPGCPHAPVGVRLT